MIFISIIFDTFITHIDFYFRHAITAAHCICTSKKDDPSRSFVYHCLEASINQIRDGKNIVFVAGGSNLASELDSDTWSSSWSINNAYIKDDDPEKHDIGILELDSKYPHKFFNPSLLAFRIFQKKAKIVPICLGALNVDKRIDSSTEIIQLGWGFRYEESPRDPKKVRDPIYSSCMTSQASPIAWRFQNCDMKKLQVLDQNGQSKWECIKNRPPPEYDPRQEQRCEDYFNEAENVEDELNEGKTLSETWLKDVDRINVNPGINDKGVFMKQDQCYNPKLLRTFGWCYLSDFKEKRWKGGTAWGICSPSCQFMQVHNLKCCYTY